MCETADVSRAGFYRYGGEPEREDLDIDNAGCESFIKTLKYEEVYRQEMPHNSSPADNTQRAPPSEANSF
jgi:hypothetical protein